jgi:Toprim domain
MSSGRDIVLGLGGSWHGTYGVACCPAHDDRTPSLSVKDAPDGRLLVKCHAGCDFDPILAGLRARGLIEGSGHVHRPDPAEAARRRAEEQASIERRKRLAKRTWDETIPIAGTLAETYLRNRAIRSPLPPSLRFHRECWHKSARPLPALVAAVQRGDEIVAVHRTYLDEPGRKASVDPEKAMLGPVAGGAVRLSTGSGPLVVAEGIETSLSVLDGLHGLDAQVWAALSAGGIAGLELPAAAGELVIAPDPKPIERKAAVVLAKRAARLGWRVKIMEPPQGGGDWNDAARASEVAA